MCSMENGSWCKFVSLLKLIQFLKVFFFFFFYRMLCFFLFVFFINCLVEMKFIAGKETTLGFGIYVFFSYSRD